MSTGADLLCDTLLAQGVDTCFANPGTSEMAFVAALDRRPALRCVLGLQENVVTGAADGYARMAGRPAAVLLHLGPGLANGLANLHNARRAGVPVIAIVGDHCSTHLPRDAPLTSDIAALAAPVSAWVRRVASAATIEADTAAAVAAARAGGGRVATLILPADAAWAKAPAPRRPPVAVPVPDTPDPDAIARAAALLRSGRRVLIVLGGSALRPGPLRDAARIGGASGATLLCEQANARIAHGRGRATPQRIAYAVETALEQLAGVEAVILAGARAPVAFFEYPGMPGDLLPPGAEIVGIAPPGGGKPAALAALRDALGIAPDAAVAPGGAHAPPPEPQGPLTGESIAAALIHAMPENAILCDESISYSETIGRAAAHAPPHDLLQLTGGAIGCGPPLATGAAIACPDRKVINMQADGSALYTLQALWTQARESLDVVTVILANRSYACLYGELARIGHPEPGRNARALFDLDDPAPDWISLARGFGVPGRRVARAEDLTRALREATARSGPGLIEVTI